MKLFAWGSNSSGQLGIQEPFHTVPVPTGLSGEVSLGKRHMLVRQQDGTVMYKGRSKGEFDKLYAEELEGKWKVAKADAGFIDEEGKLFVDQVETGKHDFPWEEIHVYKGELLLVDSNRHLFTLYRGKPDLLNEEVWDKVEVRKGVLLSVRDDGKTFKDFVQEDWESSWAYEEHGEHCTFVINDEGDMFAWGENSYGGLGVGDQAFRKKPAQIEGKWKSVHTSGKLTIGVKTDDTVWEWGLNTQDDSNLCVSIKDAIPIEMSDQWKTVSCGEAYTMGIRADGKLYAWGANGNGQLGVGRTAMSRYPVRVGIATWKQVSCGRSTSTAIRDDNKLFHWGTGTDNLRPIQVNDADWKAVASGSMHWIGIQADGSLHQFVFRSGILSPVGTDKDWDMVTVGGNFHTMALKRDGSLYAWGKNANGELGIGTKEPHETPQLVGGGWKKVVAGPRHSLGIHEDGSVYGWGCNGDGKITPFAGAQLLEPHWMMEGGIDVACGEECSYILLEDHSLQVVGSSRYNLFGLRPGYLKWKRVFAGYRHAMLLL